MQDAKPMMSAESPFAEFVRRIRVGDEDAAAELVRHYEPLIRREVRMRLTDPRVYRMVDSVDICQSVLLSLFVRAAAGQYELEQPRDLRNLLVAMAQNKLVSRSRQSQRTGRCLAEGELEAVVDQRPSAEQVVTGRDLLKQVMEGLTAHERQLAELRGQGRSWPQVAEEIGGTAEGRRKQLTRALDRVTRQLGLEEEG